MPSAFEDKLLVLVKNELSLMSNVKMDKNSPIDKNKKINAFNQRMI